MYHTLYRFWNKDSELLYIGISLNAIARLSQHSKDKDWYQEVASITMEHFGSREELEKAERESIFKERPRYNIVYNHSLVERDCIRVSSEYIKYKEKRENSIQKAKDKGAYKGRPTDFYLHQKIVEMILAGHSYSYIQNNLSVTHAAGSERKISRSTISKVSKSLSRNIQ